MDWIRALIGPDESAEPWQICVRAVIVLVFGIACLRIAGRRTFAQMAPLDIFVAIVVGSNMSRVMTGKASFFGGLAATLLLVLLHRLLAMPDFRSNVLSRFIKSAPVVLVRDGVVDQEAMRSHELGQDDLDAALRLEQVENCDDVRLATFEAGGKISVVPKR